MSWAEKKTEMKSAEILRISRVSEKLCAAENNIKIIRQTPMDEDNKRLVLSALCDYKNALVKRLAELQSRFTSLN